MKHRKASIKLNRTSSHRDAMFRNMVTSLFKYERIRTTDVKAKELSRWADHLITLAKKGDLHSRRQVLSIVREKKVVHKLFEEASERYGQRPGGHTRIVKIGHRPGDAARISLIELTGKAQIDEKKTKKKTEAVKKDDSIVTEGKQTKTDKEAKALPKTKKATEAKKKKTIKKKPESQKPEAEKKDKKTSTKKDKKTSSELKQDKAVGKKKAAPPKKKATSKDKKEKKGK